MNVFQAIDQSEKLRSTIAALNLAISKLKLAPESHKKEIELLREIEQKTFAQLKDLEDRMKDTEITI